METWKKDGEREGETEREREGGRERERGESGQDYVAESCSVCLCSTFGGKEQHLFLGDNSLL